ncbi:MAG: GspE/PulE family protein [Candidatus Acidiferrales bacterium]
MALEEHQRKLMLLGEVLLERKLVTKDDLVASLEEVTKVQFINCFSATVETEALSLVSREAALRHCVLPIAIDGKKLVVAMAEPLNIQIIDDLRFSSGKIISPRLGFRTEIITAIEKYYESPNGDRGQQPAKGEVEKESTPLGHVDIGHIEFNGECSRQTNQKALQEIKTELRTKPTPAVRLVSAAIAIAVEKDASDIHIEPQGTGMVLRMRVDGILRELAFVPADLQSTVISRIKVLADMDIAERRKPQDGRIGVRVGKKNLDLRISTLPTHHGEKVVMRLLDPSAPRLRFRDLGMSAGTCETLERILSRPQGMLLVTGPTGSGKSTTLYAGLNLLRSPSVNIVTVEDPIEYQLEGVNQVQVHTKAGLTFAGCLRSILRQDPNIIMVGEIRDSETAEIALKAAQTGHLVLTTVHTNDSIAAIARLIDLKVSPSLMASSVTAIMSQRLVRKLCRCSEQVMATPEYVAQMIRGGMEDESKMMSVPGKCSTCDQTGYKGRIAVSEILLFDEDVRTMIRSDARPDQIRAVSHGKGMRTMREDALDKVRAGLTTLEEVLRVVPMEEYGVERCCDCARELAQTFLFCPYCGTKRRATQVSVPVLAGGGGYSV